MSDKLKPLTKAEWELRRNGGRPMLMTRRVIATLDALFRYRERTRGYRPRPSAATGGDSEDIAREEGLE